MESSAQIDIPGQKTLEAISSAHRFNDWMVNTIKPFCKGHVLEVGCGIGNISKLLIKNNFKVTLSDYSDQYFDILRKDFGDNGKIENIHKVDLVEKNFESVNANLLSKFDTIIAMNVVEHIFDDHMAIRNCRKMLAPGGHLIILVPAYQLLFNSFDKELVHFRRYTKKTLTKLFEDENFEIIHKQYFNAAGIAGWYVNGSILKKKLIPEDQMKLFDKLVPAFKLVDKLIANQAGLSVIHVGRKNS